ncbi:tRNA wybutosine-synthesizing protein 4-like isoform X2 [Sycon ciliatum]|uniref:tRNA wybutosine-synthesizing protein 4-like isoform X2 n=1 Tax=Sycon ciliatum TaxID=27933 RepID=UPI0031F6B122
MKTRKSRHETAVQGTNDSSIVSKLSMVARGYFDDPYLREVVRQPCRRAPLINRGYYIRSLVIDNLYKTFLDQFSGQLCQIVCLGAGYDTAFYRLFSAGLLSHCHYFEVDFDRVLLHKQQLIDASPLLSGCASEIGKSPNCLHKLVPCDLKSPDQLTGLLDKAGIDWTMPTLLVSECVLTYLTPAHSAKVIQWAGTHFSNAIIAVYEQTHPTDPFGQIMLQHFRKIGSPIEVACSTPGLHVQRLLDHSWSQGCCHTALECFHSLVDEKDLQRISSLESFDEFEEWHLKAQHYVLACGAKGLCANMPCLVKDCTRHQCVDAPSDAANDRPAVQCIPIVSTGSCSSQAVTCVERFGHSSVLLGSGDRDDDSALVLLGGFGAIETKHHQRIQTVDVLKLHTAGCDSGSPVSTQGRLVDLVGTMPENVMFAKSVGLSSSEVLVFDGRSSPMKCSAGVHRLLISSSPAPSPAAATETAAVTKCNGKHCTAEDTSSVASRGQDPNAESQSASGESAATAAPVPQTASTREADRVQRLHVTCSPVPCSGEAPCPRWRHTVTMSPVEGKPRAVVFGGRTPAALCTADIHALDVTNATWTKLETLPGHSPVPRHSHSATSWKDEMIVISGGLDASETLCCDSCWLLDASTSSGTGVRWTELCFDPPLPGRYSHSSHVVDNMLVLVGGVSAASSQPSIILANLCSRTWQLLDLQVPTREPLLLHNHSSHLIRHLSSDSHPTLVLVGGGGNCFSFGTHFNSELYCVALPMLQ